MQENDKLNLSHEVRSPNGHNPLTPSETNRSKQIADSSDQVKRALANAAGSTRFEQLAARSPNLGKPLKNVQPLYTQRHTEDKNADPQSRKADVLYYNYSTNEVIRVVVDLNSDAVQETQVASGAANQPFITRPEIETGLQLIFDSQGGDRLRKAYQDITGQPLTDVARQLKDAQGGIYFYDPATPMGPVTADCAQDRCMQLFIPIDDASYIDMALVVVNLTKMKVLSTDVGITPHIH